MGRFDSYWAISDALGVADLSRQSWNMLRGVFTRKRDNGRRSVMPVYSLYRRVIILGYSLVMILLIGWFSLMLVRVIGPLSSSLRSGSEAIGRDIEAGRVAATMHGLVAEGPGLLMFGVTIYRLAKMVWGPAAKAVSFVHRGLRFGR